MNIFAHVPITGETEPVELSVNDTLETFKARVIDQLKLTSAYCYNIHHEGILLDEISMLCNEDTIEVSSPEAEAHAFLIGRNILLEPASYEIDDVDVMNALLELKIGLKPSQFGPEIIYGIRSDLVVMFQRHQHVATFLINSIISRCGPITYDWNLFYEQSDPVLSRILMNMLNKDQLDESDRQVYHYLARNNNETMIHSRKRLLLVAIKHII